MARISITYREVRDWPGKVTTWPSNAPFKMTTTRMWDGLENHARLVGTCVGIQAAVAAEVTLAEVPGEIALIDAELRELALEYTRNGQRYRFSCDKFKQWLDNLDAIVRSLEALRMMDRYGVMAGQQYEGFKALPEKSSASATITVQQAAELLARLSGNGMRSQDVLSNALTARDAFRRARAAAHPDRHGGQHEDFIAVTAAATALTGYFGERIDG